MKRLTGHKYLVTGGAGFIGSHICEEIVKQGKQVICLDNVIRKQNLEPWWNPRLCTFVHADVVGYNKIKPYFKDVDVVFHNAASKCTVCRDDPARDLSVNALGSLNVFTAAMNAGAKVIHASTGSVNNGNPKSYYGASKQAAESYLNVLENYYPNFKSTCLRYYHVYGPRQDNGDKGGVVPIFIRNVLNGKPIYVTGDGGQTRHFTYVKDVVEANFTAAERDIGSVWDVVSDTIISIYELARRVSGLVGIKNPQIKYLPEREGDIRFFNINNMFVKSLGINFTPFDEGLKKTFDWYSEQHVVNNISQKWTKAVKSYEDKTHDSQIMDDNIPYTVELGGAFREFMNLEGRKKVIDLGCGNGLLNDKKYSEVGYAYVDPGHELYGCDVIDYQDDYPGKFVKADAQSLPFEDGFFDVAVCVSTLDHLVAPWGVFLEANRVLKPEGRFYLSQGILHDNPKFRISNHKHHIFDFSIDSVVGLFEKTGFQDINYRKASKFQDCVVWFFEGRKPCN